MSCWPDEGTGGVRRAVAACNLESAGAGPRGPHRPSALSSLPDWGFVKAQLPALGSDLGGGRHRCPTRDSTFAIQLMVTWHPPGAVTHTDKSPGTAIGLELCGSEVWLGNADNGLARRWCAGGSRGHVH